MSQKGDIDFNLPPKPAHTRTLENLHFWANKGFDETPNKLRVHKEPAIIRELIGRIVGVTLPEDHAEEIFAALRADLLVLYGKCKYAGPRMLVEKTIDWLERNYGKRPLSDPKEENRPGICSRCGTTPHQPRLGGDWCGGDNTTPQD